MTVTTKDLQVYLGLVVGYHVNGLVFDVVIYDVRTVWGKLQFNIMPTEGTGKVWVDRSSVRLPLTADIV